jgi:hypothetical protein
VKGRRFDSGPGHDFLAAGASRALDPPTSSSFAEEKRVCSLRTHC